MEDKKTKEIMQRLGMGEEILPHLEQVRLLRKSGVAWSKIAEMASRGKILLDKKNKA